MRLSIQTRRLTLRAPTVNDLPAYLAYRNEPSALVSQMMAPTDEEDARSFLNCQSQLEADASGWMMFGIERLACSGLVGEVGVFRSDADPAQGDLGWWLHSGHRGQGYAVEAAEALLTWCFREGKLHRATAKCLSANEASQAVMRRIGMRLESRLIESSLLAGRWHDEVGYAVLKREWADVQADPTRDKRWVL